jgi:hypothetical protein
MSTQCGVCRLPAAGAIDEALRSGRTARDVAAEYALSYDAVTRHARNHLARRMVETAITTNGTDPLDELVATLRVKALAGDPAIVREYRLALAAQTAAAHANAPVMDLTATAEWIEVRTRILEILEAHPDALAAMRGALE